MKTRYQNSVCRRGVLHDFLQVALIKKGSLERCKKCGITKHFPMNTPNHIYLSYHIRSALQRDDVMFNKEYKNL